MNKTTVIEELAEQARLRNWRAANQLRKDLTDVIGVYIPPGDIEVLPEGFRWQGFKFKRVWDGVAWGDCIAVSVQHLMLDTSVWQPKRTVVRQRWVRIHGPNDMLQVLQHETPGD